MCSITSFINRNSGAGKPDTLAGTIRLPAHFQPGFPKLLSTEITKVLQLPVPKLVGKRKALALIFYQVSISKQFKKGTHLQITALRKKKKNEG